MSIAAVVFGSVLVAASAANAGLQIGQLRRRAGKRRPPVSVWRILAFETEGSIFRIALALLVYGIWLLLRQSSASGWLWVLLGVEAAILAWTAVVFVRSRIRRNSSHAR